MIKRKSKIYIVDDDSSVRKSLIRLMRSARIEVEAYDSAQSFLNSVPSDTLGILILDLCMPAMNGFELQDKLILLRYKVKVIFITAQIQDGDSERAIKKGAIGFLQKPFTDESLFDLVNSVTVA